MLGNAINSNSLQSLTITILQTSMSGISVTEDAVNLYYYLKAKSVVRHNAQANITQSFAHKLTREDPGQIYRFYGDERITQVP